MVWASETDVVLVHAGDGVGGFDVGTVYAAGNFSTRIVGGDIDGDGDLDLVVGNEVGDSVSYLANSGDGTFAPQVLLPVAGESPAWVRVDDINGDDALDIITADRSTNNLSVFMGANDGSFAPVVSLDPGGQARGVDTADLNEDGIADIVTSLSNTNVAVFLSAP